MASYGISVTRSARKELESCESELIEKIMLKIKLLATVPYPTGCLKIQGQEDLWRIRVGNYRIIYSIDKKEKLINIIAIRHRKEAYREF